MDAARQGHGLTEDDIRPGDSPSNVSTSTNASKGSRTSLAKAKAKKAALLAKQKRQAERLALEQQKLQLEAQEAAERIKQADERSRATLEVKSKRKMLEFQEESLQLQTEIDEQEAQERVYQQLEEYEQLTGLPRPSPGSQQINQVSEMFQQLHIDKNSAASQVNAPLDQHVTVRRKQVTILDSVNAVSQSTPAVSSAQSSAPTGEANWEQLTGGNKDDAMVTSTRVVTPDLTTPGIIRQIPAAPTMTTYSAQDARAQTTIQPTSSSLLAAQHAPQQPVLQTRSQALSTTAQRTGIHQTISASASPYLPRASMAPQHLSYDSTPQQAPYDPHATSMPSGPYGTHYYGQSSQQQLNYQQNQHGIYASDSRVAQSQMPQDVQFQYPAVNIVPNQQLVYQPVQVPVQQQQSSNDVNRAMLALLQQQSLPRAELLTFDGDPKKYHAFCTSFADNIERLVDNPRQRLTYLIQYCEGKAKAAIKNCVVGGDYDKGYQ